MDVYIYLWLQLSTPTPQVQPTIPVSSPPKLLSLISSGHKVEGQDIQSKVSRSPCPFPVEDYVAQTVKRLPAVRETWVRSLDWEDSLEKEMATHSSTLAWKIPWTKVPGRLQSMELQRVGHN